MARAEPAPPAAAARLTGHHHVALSVSDLGAALRFYTWVLDMEELFSETAPDRSAAVLRFGGGPISVGLVEHAGSARHRFDPAVTGLDHLAFAVASREELAAWASRLDEAGVEHSGPIEVPPGEILNFKDPDGIALALFWDRPGAAPAPG